MNFGELIKVNFQFVSLYLLGSKVETSDFKRSYDIIASSYDDKWYSYIDPVTTDMLSNISGLTPKFILDVGCGTGSSTCKLQNMFHDAHITGLDFSKPMLELARAKLGSEKILLFRETIEKGLKRFSDSQFDLITCVWSLGYSQDKRVYKELYRILSDNGHLLIITNKQDTLNAVKVAMKHTMFTHYKAIQKVPLHKFPEDKEFLLSKLGKNFQEVKYGEGSLSIDITTQPSILEWLLNTGIMAGYEYVLDLRTNTSLRKTFNDYMKANFKEITHNYMWLLVKKI